MTPQEASAAIVAATGPAVIGINEFSKAVLRTRGGRLGSGMGTLLEALWGYYVNQVLIGEGGKAAQCELGWLADHEYNDFACVQRDQEWIAATRIGEFFRIEAKSMNASVDESKGHFDEIIEHLGDWELLVVLVWSWESIDAFRVYPRVRDHFIGPARAIARLRDRLHLARGGSFVDRIACPDGCSPEVCRHHGEPLNADGKRERLSGPVSRRPANVSYAANFGGLVRMLKTSSSAARGEFRVGRAEYGEAHRYISFIHRNFPAEERNQYSQMEWATIATKLGISPVSLRKDQLIASVREAAADYQELLRSL